VPSSERSAGRLTRRALNRATLDRQLLLGRAAIPARQAVTHLAGLQAQAPLAPYVGLWTRLDGFRPEHLADLLTERAAIRAHLMRNTVHLVSAEDYVSFRPLFQLRLERALAGTQPTRAGGRRLAGVDLAELAGIAAPLLTGQALTRPQLSSALAAHWPGHDPGALAYAASHLLALVQVPPRGLWGQGGQATFMLASSWLAGRDLTPPDPDRAVEQLVVRFLAAYGPASVADIQAWSGLTRLREVTGRLGDRLCRLTGPDGEALLDLPEASRPDPGVPAPPRFLPEYDNLLLSFADRSRVIPHQRPVPLPPGNGATTGTLLLDGEWQGDWKITKHRDTAVLEVRPYIGLQAADRDAITEEGARLLRFAAPAGTTHDVRFTSLVRAN